MRDTDVRIAVREMLNAEHKADGGTRIVEEMGVWNGSVRVDLAVINGELAGYEIKSAKDTLTRLPNQAALYNEVFDRVYLVAAEKHISHARSYIPKWWGIISARPLADTISLEIIRSGKINPRINPTQLARLLWRDEAIAVLDKHAAAKGVRSETREKVISRLIATLPLNDLRDEVRSCLKARPTWLGQPVRDQRDMSVRGEA